MKGPPILKTSSITPLLPRRSPIQPSNPTHHHHPYPYSTQSPKPHPSPAYILSATRTPVGTFNGSLSSIPAPNLASHAISSLLARTTLPPTSITSAYIGNVLSASLGQAPARQALLLPPASFSPSIDCTTINKVCSSGLKAASLAAQQINLGLDAAVIAGGMESMSRVPFYLPRGPQTPPFGAFPVNDGLISDGLWDPYKNMHMGLCAEKTARDRSIPRQAQDAFAVESYARARRAWANGSFRDEVTPIQIPAKKKGEVTTVAEDEGLDRLKPEKVAGLRPAFDPEGTITAANSSSFNDGASALLLCNADLAREHGASSRVLARVLGSADAAVAPIDFSVAPASAVPVALERAGVGVKDVAAWEINEAFASVVLANAEMLGLDEGLARVNAWGGAIALGHAIGSSGSRILVTLLHRLKVGEVGCAAICNGGGAATAMVVRRVGVGDI